MRLVILLVCLAAVSYAAPKHKHHHHKHKDSLEEEVKADSDPVRFQSISDVDQQWKNFKRTHGKTYEGTEEEKRKEIFSKNLQEIASHNELYDQGVETYKQGITQFADLTNEEFIKQITCLPQTNISAFSENLKGQLSTPPPELFPAGIVLPDSTDWRSHGVVTRVKNQGHCGSCWAFAAVAALESQLYIKTREGVLLSEQNLVDCSNANYGCYGGWPHLAYFYIQRNGGIDTEDSYQYEAEDGRCRYDAKLRGGRVDDVVQVRWGSEDSLQRAVAYIGPVVVAIDASGLQHYASGIYSGHCSTYRLNHAVVVVGYKTSSPGRDYWIIKNSWGVHWGMDGYVLLPRNKGNTCGIGTYSVYPVVY